MKRCVLDHRFCGFEIGSHVGLDSLDSPKFDPIYKTASSLGVCLFVHPWDMDSWNGRLDKYWMQWLVGMPAETTQAICSVLMGGVLNRHPALKLCFAHGGGTYPYTAGRIQHGHKECAQAPSTFNHQIYTDSLTHNIAALKLLLSTVGEGNVVFGSDYPFVLGDLTGGQDIVDTNQLDKTQKNKIFWDNAMKMLNLDENEFKSD